MIAITSGCVKCFNSPNVLSLRNPSFFTLASPEPQSILAMRFLPQEQRAWVRATPLSTLRAASSTFSSECPAMAGKRPPTAVVSEKRPLTAVGGGTSSGVSPRDCNRGALDDKLLSSLPSSLSPFPSPCSRQLSQWPQRWPFSSPK